MYVIVIFGRNLGLNKLVKKSKYCPDHYLSQEEKEMI